MHNPASEKRTAKNTRTDDWSSAFFTTTKVEPQRRVENASASSARNRWDMPKDRLSQDCAKCKGFLMCLVRKGASGRLPNDRPHQFKFNGSYETPLKLMVSGNCYIQSRRSIC